MSKCYIGGAGSGKTTYFVEEVIKIKDKKVLITTFTENNRDEIKNKIMSKNGSIPENIIVQTWFSFLLQHWVRPYQSAVHQDFKNYEIRGMLLVNGSSNHYKNNSQKSDSNKKHFYYYFTKNHLIYSDKIAHFGVNANKNSNNNLIKRLEKIFNYIYIDEVQDMAGYDFEIINELLHSNIVINLFGDPRQEVFKTNHSRKYSKYNNGKFDEYLNDICNDLIKKNKFEIDYKTFSISHRCTQEICDLSNKLFPNMPPIKSKTEYNEEHLGVYWVEEQDIEDYVKQFNPTELGYNKNTKYHNPNNSMNFGQSKGLTLDRVLIHTTKDIMKWLANEENHLSLQTRAKLYVALTRAKYSVGIVKDKTIKQNKISNTNIKVYAQTNQLTLFK